MEACPCGHRHSSTGLHVHASSVDLRAIVLFRNLQRSKTLSGQCRSRGGDRRRAQRGHRSRSLLGPIHLDLFTEVQRVGNVDSDEVIGITRAWGRPQRIVVLALEVSPPHRAGEWRASESRHHRDGGLSTTEVRARELVSRAR
jgi:hypothetical protein